MQRKYKFVIILIMVIVAIVIIRMKKTPVSNTSTDKGSTASDANPEAPVRPPTVPPQATLNIVFHLPLDSTPFVDKRGRSVTMVGEVVVDTGIVSLSVASARFNGASYLSIPWSPDLRLSGDFTVQGWARRTGDPNRMGCILSYGHFTRGILIRPGGHADSIYINGRCPGDINAGFPVDVWVYFCLTRTGDALRFFVNGKQIIAYSDPLGVIDVDQPVLIGSGVHNTGERFQGNIEDLRVINGRALDGTEVPLWPLLKG